MDIDGVKKFVFWAGFFIFVIIMFLTLSSARMTLLMRFIVILLLALLSAWFRMEIVYSILSIGLTLIAAITLGGVFANSGFEFWLFMILFIAAFFGSAYLWENNTLGV